MRIVRGLARCLRLPIIAEAIDLIVCLEGRGAARRVKEMAWVVGLGGEAGYATRVARLRSAKEQLRWASNSLGVWCAENWSAYSPRTSLASSLTGCATPARTLSRHQSKNSGVSNAISA